MDITKEEILDYCTTSPENTNRNYLNDLLDQFEEGVLPEVTEEDNGKVLKVSNGAWDKGTETKELPEVTAADNGKVLGVANGAWGKVDAPSGDAPYFAIDIWMDADVEGPSEGEAYDASYLHIRQTASDVYNAVNNVAHANENSFASYKPIFVNFIATYDTNVYASCFLPVRINKEGSAYIVHFGEYSDENETVRTFGSFKVTSSGITIYSCYGNFSDAPW